ncbi:MULTISPECIES: cyclase family protein [unclassified Chelatococcus]|uniref:cyclase family protein n=1 Tax=unclassified Chelatococcus TaxID=2638111 RepID=UPI001BD0D471|nr:MULTISPECIES: cyclase family protein [unclassified Chelatococcus]MBS7699943.1 cyclase family protein [Chelatococcus sp. YT9]MBX3558632.1 cyclase family protein [Chelatococcus sp.]
MVDPNDLTLEAWSAGAATVTQGRIVELGRVFYAGMPHYPTHPDFDISLFRRHGDRVRGDGASSASCLWSFGGHTGTHIDALCHVSHCGLMYDGSAVDNNAIERGDGPGDAAAFPSYVRRGVLFDIAGLDGVDRLQGERVITADDFENACRANSFDLQKGDVALVRTGWAQHWGTDDYIGHETPGPDLEGARWLAGKGVTLVGSDTAVFEKGPIAEAAPVHHLLLMEHRIHIMENLDLEALAAARIYTFFFLALPLRVRGGTASPLRPIAIY